MIYSRVIGTGAFLPEKILTNADLEKVLDTTDEWIFSRTGIRQRHIAGDNETTSQLAERAARDAIAKAGIEAASIDLIVVGTTTADHIFPSTATIVQERLGIVGCPAFDVQAVCTGFIYSIGVADKFIRTGSTTRALVIGAETFSRILDWNDRQTCILFGDGAGAVLLEAADEPGIVSTHLHADGRYRELLHVPSGVSTNYQEVLKGEAYLEMQGSEVFKFAVNTLGRTLDETLAANNLKKSDIDWIVPHQANIRIIQAMARKMDMPMDRVIVTVDRHGNTSAASVPLAFNEGVEDGRIQRGDMVLMEAFGGGFTWGSALIRY